MVALLVAVGSAPALCDQIHDTAKEGDNRAFDAQITAAAGKGDLAAVRALLDQHPALVSATDDGWTPLHLAVAGNQTAMVEFLIQQKAEVNAKSKNAQGWTPLYLAHKKEIATLLLANGADVNAKAPDDVMPLHLAVLNGNIDLAETLLARKADVNAKMSGGSAPLDLALDKKNEDMAVLLRRYGGRTAKTVPAIFMHLGDKDLPQAKAILDADPKAVNARDGRGRTPLLAISEEKVPTLANLSASPTGYGLSGTFTVEKVYDDEAAAAKVPPPCPVADRQRGGCQRH